MKQNEVVDALKDIVECHSDVIKANPRNNIINKEVANQMEREQEALTEAIRAVELLPELVKVAKYVKQHLVCPCNDCDEVRKQTKELLKKAKELSE